MDRTERLAKIQQALGSHLLKGFDFDRLADIFVSEGMIDGCPVTRLSARCEHVDRGMNSFIRDAQPLVSLPYIADDPMEVDTRAHWFLRLDCVAKVVHIECPDAINRSLEIEVIWPIEQPNDGMTSFLGRLIASEAVGFARSELGEIVERLACYASVLGTRGLLDELRTSISKAISNGVIQEFGERDPSARRTILNLPEQKYDLSWDFTVDDASSPHESALTADFYRDKQPLDSGSYLVFPFDDRPVVRVDLEGTVKADAAGT